MIDFTNAKMEAEPWPFVMPQKDCIFLTRALARAGIEFECYGWRDVVDGRAPLDADETKARSGWFADMVAGEARCIVVSRASEDDLKAAVKSIHVQPLAAEVAEYRDRMEARGDDVPDCSSFRDDTDLEFCTMEALAMCAPQVVEWAVAAEEGDTMSLSVSLDPAMYAHSGVDVVHMGVMEDPATGAITEMRTSQVYLIIHAAPGSEMGFVVWDVWPDIDVTLAEPTGADLLEHLKGTDAWLEATPLERAFLHRRMESGMVPPMEIRAMGDKGIEAIAIPARGEDGLLYCAFVTYDMARLIATNAEYEMVACPYTAAAGEQSGGVPGFANLDDEPVFAAYSQDFPAEAAAVTDLREKLKRITDDGMQQAADMAAQSLADGDFSSDIFLEDFFVPTPEGLYFPKRGDAGEYLAYDDPAAEPYLEILRDSGWKGQMMVL